MVATRGRDWAPSRDADVGDGLRAGETVSGVVGNQLGNHDWKWGSWLEERTGRSRLEERTGRSWLEERTGRSRLAKS